MRVLRPSSWALLPRLLLLALVGLAGCEQPPVEVLRFRVGYPDLPSTLLIYVAQDHRLFAAEHLQVEAKVFPTGREALAAAMAGELDAVVVYSTPVVLAAMQGEDLVVLTTLHRSDGLTGLAVHPRAGIRSGADLRGHRIGVTPGTSSQLALDVVLAENGLEPTDVRSVPGQPRELMAALEAGELDAASLWVPNLLLATGQGPGKAQLLASQVYAEMSMLAGMRPRVEAKRMQARGFLRALLQAQVMIRRRPQLVWTTLRPRFPQLSEAQLATIISQSRFELGLSNLLLSTLRQEGAWLEQRGEPRADRVRFRDMLAPSVLEELSPEAVTLLSPPERPLR
ncbi:MAG TPA: NrtA/SsuA/CpmA family ABC transporter substrate-binding protein [Myxococcaceae bacterium]|nr:NrtA/SsuA/CpmA family ABC transporter substrate-binding protein [Myxococcaceae bacterium]